MRFVLIAVLACALAASVHSATIVDPNFDYRLVIPNMKGAGLTFNAAGDLFVYDFQAGPSAAQQGCLYKFPNAANIPYLGQHAFSYGATCATSQGSSGMAFGLGFNGIVATASGRIYTTNGRELDPNTGQVVRIAWNNCGGVHGIAVSPVDGSIFFVNYYTGAPHGQQIFKVANPDNIATTQNTCSTPFADTGASGSGIDGVTVGPDGVVYAAAYDTSELFIYSPTGALIGRSYSGGAAGSGPDGISICFGDGVSFAITADSGANKITKFNLTGLGGAPTYAASTLVVNTGGYNDWTAVDPHGCIWVSTVNGVGGIWRLSNADGSCMQCNQPQQPPHSSCPNCTTVQTVTYQGLAVEHHTASGQGDCVSLKFQ